MKYNLAWLKQQYEGGARPGFLFFADIRAGSKETTNLTILTQWFRSPFLVDNELYHHAAHWMMVQKARLFNDPVAAVELLKMSDNKKIHERGKQISGFDQKHWEDHRYNIVMRGNLHKFTQHPALRAYLSGTYPLVLAEANPDDKVWGIGLSEDAPGASDPHLWNGHNLLGFALMEVRDVLCGTAEETSSAI